MSLINDALKRAQEAQQNNPTTPPAGPPLRPVEPRHGRGAGPMALLVVVLLLVLAGTGILLWQWVRTGDKPQQAGEVAAQPAPPPVADEPPAGAAQPTGEAVSGVRKPEVASQATQPSTQPETATKVDLQPHAEMRAGAATGEVQGAVPKPAPLRLQGILYSPRGSLAVINGKSVGVGERIGEARVIAVTRESVTIVVGGRTNVLEL